MKQKKEPKDSDHESLVKDLLESFFQIKNRSKKNIREARKEIDSGAREKKGKFRL